MLDLSRTAVLVLGSVHRDSPGREGLWNEEERLWPQGPQWGIPGSYREVNVAVCAGVSTSVTPVSKFSFTCIRQLYIMYLHGVD